MCTLIASETRDFDQSFIIAHFREIYVSDEMIDKARFKPENFLLICHLYALIKILQRFHCAILALITAGVDRV